MVSTRPQPTTWDTSHEDMIHDLQLDYYGKRLATCSSDSMIKIFEVGAEGQTLSANIAGHEGPVWQVAWAHPKFSTVLASCSFDRKVCLWKEFQAQSGQWTKIYEFTGHQSSVNAISFAPHELGLRLACASADCTISILTWRGGGDGDWDERSVPNAHQIGCNAVSWAPAAAPASATSQAPMQMQAMLVTGGCDGAVKVWRLQESGEIMPDPGFEAAYRNSPHSGWVRDVAWAPSIGMPVQTIASCAEDKMVYIWSQAAGKDWVCRKLPPFEAVVWRLSWSVAGNVLAVSAADGKVTLWKEGLGGQWALIDEVSQ
mmetsp:Transcript_32210/g.79017  ORF Transcript_32210/g.79017 Transcript_32210/m.79017 type:complete len:315 (-) Transcript_32210:452-1396(-)